jgi:predicted O-methyltransferase YrrM
MIDEKIFNYIYELNKSQLKEDLYNNIINYDSKYKIPAIRFDVALFLNFLSIIFKPKKILEIGFGSGVSSIYIVKDINPEMFITLERDKNRYIRGQKLLRSMNIDKIKLVNEDAFDFFKNNKNNFDLIFLDSVKREYIEYIEPIDKILNKDGIFITDNILFNGKITNNHSDKYKDGIKLLDNFNNSISNNENFKTVFLSIGDGISLSIKK